MLTNPTTVSKKAIATQKKKRGRPNLGRRQYIVWMKPSIMALVDSQIEKDDPELASRGRVIEYKLSLTAGPTL